MVALGVIALAASGCAVPAAVDGDAGATGERAVTIDSPLADLIDGLHDQLTAEASPAPGTPVPVPATIAAAPAPQQPGAIAVDAAARVTTASAALVLMPEPCGALTLEEGMRGAVDCDDPLVRSGTVDDREFVAGLRFDLRSITAGTEVAEAALVLTGLDDALKRDVGEWYVELVDFTHAEALDAVSFAQLVGAPSAPGDCTWRLRAADLSPGARNVLAFGDDARRALASRVTTGEALFRIDGPVGVTNAFAWHARGADGPRLRIEFAAAHDGATTQATPLVVWEPTP